MDPYKHAVGVMPSPMSALSLFEGEWSSQFPQAFVGGSGGPGGADLFEDARIHWLLDELGPVAGWNVLELGPLEGGHTYMLDRAGARVTAIESNSHAYLKCLVGKELVGGSPRFLYGDFMVYLEDARRRGEHFDLVVASGVLYHMQEPLELLELLGDVSSRIFLWTHYFDPDSSHWAPPIRARMTDKWASEPTLHSSRRLRARAWRQSYLESLEWAGFSGGPSEGSLWLHRQDLLTSLATLGFEDVRITHDQPDHPNGPAFSLLAQKGSAR
jgi:hypothetical protein